MFRMLFGTVAIYSLALISGCSGGGGGGSDNSISISVSPTSVSASATTDDPAPASFVTVTASKSGNLYAGAYTTNSAVASVDFVGTSNTSAKVNISFKSPVSLGVGIYTDTVTIYVCYDANCNQNVVGSPTTVPVTFTVTQGTGTGGGTASASLNTTYLGASTNVSSAAPSSTATVYVNNPQDLAIYSQINSTSNGVQQASFGAITAGTGQITVQFKDPATLSSGTFSDTVTLKLCYDAACTQQIGGSPLTLQTTYTVTGPPAPDRPVVPVQSVTALPHDVVDAEYSPALDAIVMVSSYPLNALYLYDVGTGAEKSVTLNKVPTAVSVSPDGLAAAVGHDALITYINLQVLSQTGTATPTLLNVSAPVFDIVLAGDGYVHAFPTVDQWVNIHSVNIATNTETLDASQIYAGTRAKLHPSGTSMYIADNGLSPSNIEKFDTSNGPASFLYDSPYWGAYPMCGNLWISEDGVSIYTACGNVFRSSNVPSLDMVYNGSLTLSQDSEISIPYEIAWLSQSSEKQEIALIEYDSICETIHAADQCRNYLDLYDSQFLNRAASYSVPPMTIGGHIYAQRGLFVFYGANGNGKYMISHLLDMPNPNAEYYISALQ